MIFDYPLPRNYQGFESLCLRLFREHWKVSDLKTYAGPGRQQSGVDLIGCKRTDEGEIIGVQCKLRSRGKKLSKADVLAEIEKAKYSRP